MASNGRAFIVTMQMWVVVTLLLLIPASLCRASTTEQRAENGVRQADQRSELETAIALTRAGKFSQAIPRLLALQGHVTDEFALKFNLALCYVAVGEAAKAIPLLQSLPDDPRRGQNADNLLAQAYIGNGQSDEALKALDRAAQKYPNNEKLFLYVADACMAYQDYSLGLRAMDRGLQQLPKSASLHYEKAVFLTLLDDFDIAKREFDQAYDLAPDKPIGFVAAAHKNMMSGDIESAVRIAREGVQKKRADYLLLTFLGQALIRFGAEPGQPEFNEARASLERAVAERPNYADSRLALGNVYATENRLKDALQQLEVARDLQPRAAAVYASLAKVYRRLGKMTETDEALATLRAINQEQVARIANAPGEVKAGYGRTPHY